MTTPAPGHRRGPLATVVAGLGILALAVAAYGIVRPFLVAFVWAATVVVVTWPLLLGLQARLRGSRTAAVAVMVSLLLLLVAVPLTVAVAAVVLNAESLADRARAVAATFGTAAAPAWLAGVPLVGARLAALWQDVAGAGTEGALRRLAPYAGTVTGWMVGKLGNVGHQAIQFVLTLVFAAVLYANGERLAAALRRMARALWGPAGERAVGLARRSVHGVALGVGAAAAIQSVLAGLGLAVAGVPFAGLLTAALFLLCLAQVGMLVLLIPIVVWVLATGDTASGLLLAAWSVGVSVLDQIVRPVLVGRHADLPALLIFVGVVGGLVAFGLLGVVVGPVVLAVVYTLLGDWLREDADRIGPDGDRVGRVGLEPTTKGL